MDEIAQTLRTRRVEMRLTQAEAADLAGVSERFVRAVEAGKPTVQLDKVQALATMMGLQIRLVTRSAHG